jgi:putative transposase
MWTSSIRPEDIRLPDDSTQLAAVMGRVYRRVLTHRGIEFEGLFYNSPDLYELRVKEGPTLEVEIRVDESDIGSIFVLWPKTNSTYRVPALDLEYASGISAWQHERFKKWQRRRDSSNQNPSGWLEAKEDMRKKMEEDLHLKRRRTRMRAARHGEASERAATKASARKAAVIQFEATVNSSPRSRTAAGTEQRQYVAPAGNETPVARLPRPARSYKAILREGNEHE